MGGETKNDKDVQLEKFSIQTDDNSQEDEKQDTQEKKQQINVQAKINKYKLCGKFEIDVPLVSLMLMNFFLNAACSVITPFFPPLAREVNLSNFQTGLIIGIHPLSGFIFGLLMSKNLMKFGRKRVMLISVIVTILTCTGMGLGYLLREKTTAFFILNLICRSFMGMARSGYGSATFAYAPMLWPHKVEKMIGLLESASGLGQTSGPFIGTAIQIMCGSNEALKYQMVFYILSGLFALFVYPSYVGLPDEKKTPSKQKSLSLFSCLGRRQIWTLYFLMTFVSASVTFVFELWTDHMKTYGIQQNVSAILLASGSLAYVICLQIIPKLMAKMIRDKGMVSFRKFLESCGLALAIVILILLAPEQRLGIPQEPWPVFIAIFLAGFSQGMAILPYIPEQNMLVVKLYPKKKKLELSEALTSQVEQQMEEERIKTGKEYSSEDVELTVGEIIRKLYSDMAAGMFMSGYSCGTFMGPTLGGMIFDVIEKTHAAQDYQCNRERCGECEEKHIDPCENQYSFQQLARIIMVLCGIMLVLYMTIGEGYIGWRDLMCAKKKKKPLIVQRKSVNEYNAKDGNLTDLLLTDNDNQFTDAEPQDYDKKFEDKLEEVRKRTDEDMAVKSGSARTASL